MDIDHDETREEFEKLGKLVVKGDKATILWDLAGQGQEKEAIIWAEFTILKVGLGQAPIPIDLRLEKFIEIQGLKPKIGATLLGICSLDGGSLKVFFDEEARPKAFPAKEKQGVMTLKRVERLKGKDAKPAEKPRPKDVGGAPLKADRNGFAVVGATVREAQVEFELAYGRNVDGIVKFVVENGEGKSLWVVAASGQNGIRKITFGIVPLDPSYSGTQQQHPSGNQKPEDIRGKQIRIQVHYRCKSLLGPGVEIYDRTVDVPAE